MARQRLKHENRTTFIRQSARLFQALSLPPWLPYAASRAASKLASPSSVIAGSLLQTCSFFEDRGCKRISTLRSVYEMDMAGAGGRRRKTSHHCSLLTMRAVANDPFGR